LVRVLLQLALRRRDIERALWTSQRRTASAWRALRGWLHAWWLWLVGRLRNEQSPQRARLVAHVHYDLGNDLYTRMLDARMQYSCAFFHGARSLCDANAKVNHGSTVATAAATGTANLPLAPCKSDSSLDSRHTDATSDNVGARASVNAGASATTDAA